MVADCSDRGFGRHYLKDAVPAAGLNQTVPWFELIKFQNNYYFAPMASRMRRVVRRRL